VAEEDAAQDVNGVLATCNEEPESAENDGAHGTECELDASDTFELAENDHHEPKVVAEKVVVLVSEGLNHQRVHARELPERILRHRHIEEKLF
jgi:hypothetical protein